MPVRHPTPATARGSPPSTSAQASPFDDFAQGRDRFYGDEDGYTYTRYGNPTIAAVERKLAALEHGAEAIAVGSGQAAVSVALLGLLSAGDHLLSARSIYEGSRGLFRDNFSRMGIEVDFVDDANDPQAWRDAVKPNTKAFFGESIPNPRNEIFDLAAIAAVSDEVGVPLVIDNTLATPYLVRPIEHGATVVVHSASKFLGGHGSALGGVIVDSGRFDWAAHAGAFPHLAGPAHPLREQSFTDRYGAVAYAAYTRTVVASRLGPTLSPFNAFLLQQGIETLSLRVERHSANALAVARWLEAQDAVESVDYSGLESNPYHELAQRYLPRGQGSVFSFTLKGGVDAAERFVNAVRLFTPMSHLGDVRSLVLHAASTSHANLTPDELIAAGIQPGTLRVSIGIEDEPDLLRDLEQALRAAGAAASARPVLSSTTIA
jgi:O-acetylhomoserine (thiol)-lyase